VEIVDIFVNLSDERNRNKITINESSKSKLLKTREKITVWDI